ncbi:MAG: hypothetical protein AABN33_12315, partial [Acidobacteriota bacterium]
ARLGRHQTQGCADLPWATRCRPHTRACEIGAASDPGLRGLALGYMLSPAYAGLREQDARGERPAKVHCNV